MQKTNIRQILFTVRYLYIFVYLMFTSLNKFIPFCNFVSDAVGAATYSGLAIFGAILLAADFFTRRNMFRVRYNGLLLLFFCVYVLSMVYNIQFGWVDNAKTFAWMLIQTFLLMAMDPDQPIDLNRKNLSVVFNGYIALWFVGVIMSLGQYVTQYAASHSGFEGMSGLEGFWGGRLYGVFTDPNYAAVCSIVAMLLALFQMLVKSQKLFLKTYYWVTIVANVIYVVLSGSRTGELVLLGLSVVTPIFMCISKVNAKGRKWHILAIRCICLVALCVAMTLGGIKVLKTTLPHVPGLYNKMQAQMQEPQLPVEQEITMPEETEAAEATEATEVPPSNDVVSLARPELENTDDFSNSRFKIWADSLKLFQASPLLGTSPRNHLAFAESHFGSDMFIVRRGYTVHNGFLSLLTYTGLLGAGIMFLWMVCEVAYVLGYLIRRRKTQDQHYKAVMCLTLILFAIAVSAFPLMGIFFGNSAVEVLFWLIMGTTMYLIRVSEQNENTKEPVLYRISEAMIHKFSKKRTK